MAERNLLADTSRIVEKNNKTCKRKDELRKTVTDGLIALGYNASICKSKWEKSSSIPAGKLSQLHSLSSVCGRNSNFRIVILNKLNGVRKIQDYSTIRNQHDQNDSRLNSYFQFELAFHDL